MNAERTYVAMAYDVLFLDALGSLTIREVTDASAKDQEFETQQASFQLPEIAQTASIQAEKIGVALISRQQSLRDGFRKIFGWDIEAIHEARRKAFLAKNGIARTIMAQWVEAGAVEVEDIDPIQLDDSYWRQPNQDGKLYSLSENVRNAALKHSPLTPLSIVDLNAT